MGSFFFFFYPAAGRSVPPGCQTRASLSAGTSEVGWQKRVCEYEEEERDEERGVEWTKRD